jgi:hypothetical protein
MGPGDSSSAGASARRWRSATPLRFARNHFRSERVIVAQAILWPGAEDADA